MTTQYGGTPNIEATKIMNYRDLIVWARSMDLVEVCYKLSRGIPQSEIYGLISQIRRAAVSIPANIAEGHGRRSLGEYIQHLSIANGSLKELETHLLIAGRLHYVNENETDAVLERCSEIGRMLAGLIQKPRQNQRRS
jgi:four helix bundle protein